MLTLDDIGFDHDLHYLLICNLAESALQYLKKKGFVYAEEVRHSFEVLLDEFAKGEAESFLSDEEFEALTTIAIGASGDESRAIEVVM